MFKLRMFQLIYFLATLVEVVFEGVGKLFVNIAKPFEKMADKCQAKIVELDNKEENK